MTEYPLLNRDVFKYIRELNIIFEHGFLILTLYFSMYS